MAKIVRRSSILVNNTNPSELVVRYPGNDDHFLQTLLVGVFVLVLYEIVHHRNNFYELLLGPDSDIWTVSIVLFSAAGLIRLLYPIAWFAGGGHEILTVAPYGVTIRNMAFGRCWKERTFDRAKIENLRYGTVGWQKYGEIRGLLFKYDGKKIKCFRRLSKTDADYLIRHLASAKLPCAK